MRVFHAVEHQGIAPITIRQGRNWLLQRDVIHGNTIKDKHQRNKGEIVLEAKILLFDMKKMEQIFCMASK